MKYFIKGFLKFYTRPIVWLVIATFMVCLLCIFPMKEIWAERACLVIWGMVWGAWAIRARIGGFWGGK